MTRVETIGLAMLAALLWITPGVAGEAQGRAEARAQADYMIHCQGCHVPDGSGFPGKVPDLRASLPQLLARPGGRAFLVQVPGSAQSALSDARLAETLNWMVRTFGADAHSRDFAAFTEDEVSALRATRLENVSQRRADILLQPETAGAPVAP